MSVFIDSSSPWVANIASRQLIILPDVTDYSYFKESTEIINNHQ